MSSKPRYMKLESKYGALDMPPSLPLRVVRHFNHAYCRTCLTGCPVGDILPRECQNRARKALMAAHRSYLLEWAEGINRLIAWDADETGFSRLLLGG